MFARLHSVVPNPAFAIEPPAGPPARLGRRALLAEVRRRSAKVRAGITTAAVIRAERRAVPYYAAVRAALGDWTPDTIHYTPVVDRVARFLTGRGAPTVLDIGCGYGLLLKRLAGSVRAARLIGSDAIAIGARVIAAHDRQPLPDRSCDAVISTALPEMLVDPPTLARECARVVKADGLVVVTTATSHVIHLSRNPWSYVEGLLSTVWPRLLPEHHGLFEPLTPLPMTWRFFTRHELRAMYAEHFTHVEVATLHFGHLRKFGLEDLAPKLPVLRHFGGQLMVVAQGPR
jgi:SAM-dependent methyltransferase